MGLGEAAPGQILTSINLLRWVLAIPQEMEGKNRIMHHANEMRYKSRNMLRQAMGSYYNFDDSTGRQGGNYPNPFSATTASNRKINNAFKAKRPLRNKSINNKAATKQNRERPSSAKVSRKKFNVKHEFRTCTLIALRRLIRSDGSRLIFHEIMATAVFTHQTKETLFVVFALHHSCRCLSPLC